MQDLYEENNKTLMKKIKKLNGEIEFLDRKTQYYLDVSCYQFSL